MGCSQNTLALALAYLSDTFDIKVHRCSSLYRSKPLDNLTQSDYVNAVACLTCDYTPHELLARLQQTEDHFGRRRDVARWSSRTLDLDILLYDDICLTESELTIPHVGMSVRDFVLYPLFEIAPEITIPGIGGIRHMLDACENRGLEILDEHDY